jgi:hypothetical protein
MAVAVFHGSDIQPTPAKKPVKSRQASSSSSSSSPQRPSEPSSSTTKDDATTLPAIPYLEILPDDILINVLQRLSVEELLRLQVNRTLHSRVSVSYNHSSAVCRSFMLEHARLQGMIAEGREHW